MTVMCRNPYIRGTQAFGCGQCVPCKVNNRRVWVHRIMLESTQHLCNSFVTLTYRPECEPEGGNLAKKELQDWIKRLRKSIEPTRIRYYAVGEYGEKNGKPHYHLALFGYGPCANGRTTHDERRPEKKCCDVCDTIRSTWGRGRIYVGDLEDKSAGYVAGYLVAKHSPETEKRVAGRAPEFGIMSRKPGIGTDALWEIASVLLVYDVDETHVDVPGVTRAHGAIRPFGRTLKERLREYMGKEKGCPREVLEAVEEEMRPLFEVDAAISKVPGLRETIIRNRLLDADQQRVTNLMARMKIWNQRKAL